MRDCYPHLRVFPGCFTRPTGDLGLQLCRRTDHVETWSPPYVDAYCSSAFEINPAARYRPDDQPGGSREVAFQKGATTMFRVLAAAAMAVFLLTVSSASVAAQKQQATVIHACIETRGPAMTRGDIKIRRGARCPPGERPITWNSRNGDRGPQGVVGPPGPQGPVGPTGPQGERGLEGPAGPGPGAQGHRTEGPRDRKGHRARGPGQGPQGPRAKGHRAKASQGLGPEGPSRGPGRARGTTRPTGLSRTAGRPRPCRTAGRNRPARTGWSAGRGGTAGRYRAARASGPTGPDRGDRPHGSDRPQRAAGRLGPRGRSVHLHNRQQPSERRRTSQRA